MVTNSFPKKFRLLSKTDFLYLKTGCKLQGDKLIRLYFKPSLVKSSNTRVGFSISKKVGKAFLRNRLKRLMRENFRIKEDVKYLGYDILVVVNPRISGLISERIKIEKELINSFNKNMKLLLLESNK